MPVFGYNVCRCLMLINFFFMIVRCGVEVGNRFVDASFLFLSHVFCQVSFSLVCLHFFLTLNYLLSFLVCIFSCNFMKLKTHEIK